MPTYHRKDRYTREKRERRRESIARARYAPAALYTLLVLSLSLSLSLSLFVNLAAGHAHTSSLVHPYTAHSTTRRGVRIRAQAAGLDFSTAPERCAKRKSDREHTNPDKENKARPKYAYLASPSGSTLRVLRWAKLAKEMRELKNQSSQMTRQSSTSFRGIPAFFNLFLVSSFLGRSLPIRDKGDDPARLAGLLH